MPDREKELLERIIQRASQNPPQGEVLTSGGIPLVGEDAIRQFFEANNPPNPPPIDLDQDTNE